MSCYNENKNFYYMTQIFIYLLFFFARGFDVLKSSSTEFSFFFFHFFGRATKNNLERKCTNEE